MRDPIIIETREQDGITLQLIERDPDILTEFPHLPRTFWCALHPVNLMLSSTGGTAAGALDRLERNFPGLVGRKAA